MNGDLLQRDSPAFTMPRMLKFPPAGILSLILWAAFSFSPAAADKQAPSNGAVLRIGTIRVSGQNRFSEEQVIAASGLKAGQVFRREDLEATAEKLAKSGVFQEVTYSFQPVGGQVAVEFKVEESPKFRKCIFDNFVWLTDDELEAHLKRVVPFYDGTAPELGGMLDDLAHALEKLSEEKGLTVRVDRRIEQEKIGDPNWSHLFHAEGPKVTIQKLTFASTLTVNPDDIQREAAPLIGRQYSIISCGVFAKAVFLPFYRERGYLRATVDNTTPRVLSHTQGSSEFAVEVVFALSEGGVYHWEPAEWNGNQHLASPDLEALTNMQPNDLANGKKIEDGWEAIKKAYGKTGYVEARLDPEPVFDEKSLTVRYRVLVTEGPQYKMGTFSVSGVPQAAADGLKKHWSLKTGDVFDASYPGEFVSKETGSVLRGVLTRTSKLKIMTIPNRELHFIDVSFQVE